MITIADKVFFVSAILVIIATIIFWKDARNFLTGRETAKFEAAENLLKQQENKGTKIKKENQDQHFALGDHLSINQHWNLPKELKEISGIVFLDDHRFLCVQDEEGLLYIFNTGTSKIEKKIPFAGKGDYEDVTLVGATAYVLKSDGVIFEIRDFNSNHPEVKQYNTPLHTKNDCEGITWDRKRNRLLITVKNDDLKNGNPIYSFNLDSKKMDKDPAITINFDHAVFQEKSKKKNKGIQPSAIAIHPATNEYYILEGTHPKLLILDKEAVPKQLFILDKKDFAQPEGLAFSTNGEMFISNEGVGGDANILKVSLQ